MELLAANLAWAITIFPILVLARKMFVLALQELLPAMLIASPTVKNLVQLAITIIILLLTAAAKRMFATATTE